MTALLEDLGLISVADTPVGSSFIKGISTGQKRRLSIACEAIVEPTLLFVDEPTSGVPPFSLAHGSQALTVRGSKNAGMLLAPGHDWRIAPEARCTACRPGLCLGVLLHLGAESAHHGRPLRRDVGAPAVCRGV